MTRTLRGAPVQLACCVAAWLAVSCLLYPGGLDPLTPFHSDYYLGNDYAAESLLVALGKARPVHRLLFHFVSRIGFRATMLCSALLGVLYAWAVVSFFAQVAKRWPGPLAALACYALIFAHDTSRFSYSYDSTARLAGIFAVLAMSALWSWLEDGQRWRLFASFAFFILSVFSKETFILPVAVFVAWAVWQKTRSARRVLFCLAPFGLISLAALGHTALDGIYVNTRATAADAYYLSHDPRIILRNLASDVSLVFLPSTLALLVVAFWPRDDRGTRIALTALFWAMALAGYLPHALLVNHRLGYHIWQGLPFFFAFVLFIDFSFVQRRALALAGLALIAISIYGFRAKAIKQDAWYAAQQTINRNLLADLQKNAGALVGKKHTALIGFGVFFFHPWHHPRYVNELLHYQGDWFLLSRETGTVDNVHYVDRLPDHGLDCALFVSRFDGHIVRLLEGAELAKALDAFRAKPETLAAVNLDATSADAVLALP